MSHEWPAQGLTLAWFSPREFSHPDLMDASFLRLLDEVRRRCGFPIRPTDGARTDLEMRALYGDPARWPDSAHHATEDRPGTAADVQPAGEMSAAERQSRRIHIVHHATALHVEGQAPDLGLEVADQHLHVDHYHHEDRTARRPYIWSGKSR